MHQIFNPPADAVYIGCTEGADRMSEETADQLADAADPAYIEDADGSRYFFDLHPTERA
tara:strand:- start:886 stop:1062 length:177 start_codon:yes stop_codon:yes gene_type:complete